MAWSAKPKGGYSVTSEGGLNNINEIYYVLVTYGFNMESSAGVLGNVQGESGFNPWRWQSDRVNQHGGYGLFQYTPASGYINLPGATPNLSVTTVTPGATPEDGAYQVEVFASNSLSKWVPSAWRPYWSTTTYSDLYAKRAEWLTTWGNGSSISMEQFKQVTDIEAATFFMLACFEGPSIPDLANRYRYALKIYEILGGVVPPPEPPTPPTPVPGTLKYWLLKAMKNIRDHAKSADIGKR